MNGKVYFNCDTCKEIKTGELTKQTFDFEEKEIRLEFKCEVCEEKTETHTPMAKETLFR
jgi:hypothetical protein